LFDELRRFEPFGELSPAGQTLLDQGAVRKSVPRDAALLHKGQPVSGAYLVLRGRLRVFSIAPNGNEATLYFIDLGETCVLALNCLFNDLLQHHQHQRRSAVPGSAGQPGWRRPLTMPSQTCAASSQCASWWSASSGTHALEQLFLHAPDARFLQRHRQRAAGVQRGCAHAAQRADVLGQRPVHQHRGLAFGAQAVQHAQRTRHLAGEMASPSLKTS
jgi:CRP-like cAMP-binding protein